MGEPGKRVVSQALADLKRKYKVSTVIAQAENTTEGRGISVQDYEYLKSIGIDFFTGGNWSLHRKEIHPFLNNPKEPIIRPANYTKGTPGLGYKYLTTPKGEILIISLLGQIVGRDADKSTDNPLKVIDKILSETDSAPHLLAKIVNFHGDYSSEKKVIGYYLDGRVSAVIGDHWHVPTADAMILPKGTAHISDVGMCGSLDSSLGVSIDSVLPRWRDGVQTRNQLETTGRLQLNAVLITIDEVTAKATRVLHIQQITDQ